MRSLIIADVHANASALEAVVGDAQPFGEVIFLGDTVLNGPQPAETMTLLMTFDGQWIMGNHDREILDMDPDDQTLHPWFRWVRQHLTDANLKFIANFSDTLVIERDGLVIRLHHGDIPTPAGDRIWPDSAAKALSIVTDQFSEPYILLAHSHIQFHITHNGQAIINPGSVGQTRLGHKLALYTILENGKFELKGVPYDIEKACRALAEIPMDEDFAAEWIEGYRTGTLTDRYKIRNWNTLRKAGYR